MRRGIIVVATIFATLSLGLTAAWADSPRIVGSPSTSVSGNTLTLSASVAGLGNVPSATFALQGPVTVSSRCYSKSGNKPQAANKQETINVSDTETFAVRNGRTNATFTVTPLSTLQCPKGQVVVIESVSYDLDLIYQDNVLFPFMSKHRFSHHSGPGTQGCSRPSHMDSPL
jgi:hypothetical protein